MSHHARVPLRQAFAGSAQGAHRASLRRAASAPAEAVDAVVVQCRRAAGAEPKSLRRPGGALQGRPVQASGKFPEPILNTPKSITVLTKEVLADQNSTTLKPAVLSTAGVTLGTGEGGNAFGDRFFIRGFDARNDVFLDGVRDAGVSVRENFFTEQVEILRGPGSSFAGRGTTGGAINIVTKAGDDRKELLQYGHHVRYRPHQAYRARRQPGDQPDAGGARRRIVPGCRRCRPQTTSRTTATAVSLREVDPARYGQAVRELHSHQFARHAGFRRAVLPAEHGNDRRRPVPGLRQSTAKFLRLRQPGLFQVRQDIGTVNGEIKITPDLTLSNKIRFQRSSSTTSGRCRKPQSLKRPT